MDTSDFSISPWRVAIIAWLRRPPFFRLCAKDSCKFMVRTLINLIKRQILRLTTQLGYQLLKREEYQTLLAAARMPTPLPPTPPVVAAPKPSDSFPRVFDFP